MAIEVAGFYPTHPINVIALVGGTDTTIDDGDWILWFVYYANTRTIALAAPSGWTQLRKTVGSIGTIELWRYHWSTGDPTSWSLTFTGTGDFQMAAMAVRNVASTPSLLSATHETFSPPVLIDAITNPAIANNDVALLLTGLDSGRVELPSPPTIVLNSITNGDTPNVCASFTRLTAAGVAPSYSLDMLPDTPTPTELFGLQIILPDAPVGGGWGVGQVRMGAN